MNTNPDLLVLFLLIALIALLIWLYMKVGKINDVLLIFLLGMDFVSLAGLYYYAKTKADDAIIANVLEINRRELPNFVSCESYEDLQQLGDTEKEKFVYVSSPENKEGMYVWVPTANRWVRITK